MTNLSEGGGRAPMPPSPCGALTRRAILAASPALLIAGPSVASAEPDAAILALFREWTQLRRDLNDGTIPAGDDSADWRDGFARLVDVEDELAAAVPTTPEEWAAKIIVADDGGDLDANEGQRALLRQAFHLVGRAS